MDRVKFSGEVQQLRSDMLEAEDRIVEDIDRLKELLSPDRVANFILLMLEEELLERAKAIDWPQLEEVSNKAKKIIKDHKLMSGILGIGVSGLLIYGLSNYLKNGRLEDPQRGIEVIGTHESKGQQYN